MTTARRVPKTNLPALRRALIEMMWLDYKLFGYVTESAQALARRIQREKAKQQNEAHQKQSGANQGAEARARSATNRHRAMAGDRVGVD